MLFNSNLSINSNFTSENVKKYNYPERQRKYSVYYEVKHRFTQSPDRCTPEYLLK